MSGKVLMIASYCGPYGGNFVASLIEYDKEMRLAGYKTSYVFPDVVKNFEWTSAVEVIADNIYYISYNPYSLNNILELRRIVKAEQPSLIYSRMGGWDLTARLAAPSIPMIWHLEYALGVNSKVDRIKYWCKYRLLAGRKVYHIAVSQASANDVNFLTPTNRCVSIPNAINFDRLREKNENKIHVPCNVLIFAYDPITKGLDLVLDAFEQLNREKIDYRLLVSAQVRTFDYLNNRFVEIPEWVQVLKPTDDISAIYEQADIMLSASRHEGFSYCLAEAIYSGLPVVYSDIQGTSWADEFKMTFKFKSEDVADLVKKLETCRNSEIMTEDVDWNVEKMINEYSMQTWSGRIGKEISKILNGKETKCQEQISQQ
jgi:glycosyltransferase involved in cell wall biosynthesis